MTCQTQMDADVTKPDLCKMTYRPCVGIMVLNRDGLIWIGRRSDAKNKIEHGAWWQMPQGGIDDGENPERAAKRELFEETSISSVDIIGQCTSWLNYDLPVELIGTKWGGKYRGQTQKWFAMRFNGQDSEINISPPDHEIEFDAWKWARKYELMELIVPFKREVYRAVLDELGTFATDA